MKLLKKGFSLAEVLIALGIISIIATMGFSISKRGVERAYDLYVYTGYNGLSLAIRDANGYDYSIEPNNVKNCDFTKHIINLLDAKIDETVPVTGDAVAFKAPNGIRYKMWTAYAGQDLYYAEMKVPAKKTRESNSNTICLAYAPKLDYQVLLPFQQDGTACVTTIPDIQKRKDLLPFFLDDGVVGRVKYSAGNGKPSYKKRTYFSIKDAACLGFGGKIGPGGVVLDCTGYSGIGTIYGALRLGNPRKVF